MGRSASRSLYAGLVAVLMAVSGIAVAAAEPLPPGPEGPTVRHHEALEVRVVEPAESPVRPGAGKSELTRGELGGLGVGRSRGEAVEPDGTVHVLDGADGTVVTAPKGQLDKARTENVDGADATRFGAIAYNPADDRLYAADADARTIYALDDAGRVTDTYEVTDPSVAEVSSMRFAPTADTTDDPAATSLYLSGGTDPAADPVTEVSLTLAASAVAVTATATRVKRTLTSLWSPPSPDPSDITYIPSEDRLFVADAEVEEMGPPEWTTFQGVNTWATDRVGTPVATGLTTGFSKEPAGIAYDATRDKMIVADDDLKRIFTISRGPDAQFMTPDDGVVSFAVTAPGISKTDPESVAVDISVSPNRLFVLDALNSEIYRYSLEGVLLDSWDVGQYGTVDPEALAYDKSRDLLLMVDDTCTAYELTKTAELINVIDIADARCKKSAGIVIAPASSNNGKQSMYIVDRGVDNNLDPLENDGILDELSSPTLPRVGNMAPKVNAGADKTVGHPGPVSLTATATDDGNFSPLTYAWAQVSGPGATTFTAATAKTTQATFSKSGTYVLKFSAYDGDVTSSDTVTVVSNLAPTVNAGLDTTVLHPAAASLTATATDDGNIAPLTYAWSQVSGPAGGSTTFSAATSTATQATFSQAGTYVLKFAANDGHATSEDTVTVVSNLAPTVDAGPDTTVVHPAAASLTATATDDGNVASLTYAWTQVSGPAGGSTTFSAATSTATQATFSQAGTYVLKFAANDGHATSEDTVTVLSNLAPTVDAGPDTTVVHPAAASLTATATDDGNVAPLTYAWTQTSGPAGGTTTFSAASSTATQATFSQAGTYVLKFAANDGHATSEDTVTVTSNAPPPAATPPPSPAPSPSPGPTVKATPTEATHAVAPRRILDTARGKGAPRRELGARETLSLRVEGRGGVPRAGVDTVMLNVTVASPRRSGALTLWPSLKSQPSTGTVEFDRGRTTSKLVEVAVGTNGRVSIYNGSRKPVHIIGVTEAWTGTQESPADGGIMTRLRSYRVLNSTSADPVTSDRARRIQVTGTGPATAGVPSSGVDAVVLVVQVRRPSDDGYLTVVPRGLVRPRTPSVAFDAGVVTTNRVVVPVSPRGTVKLALSAGDARVVVKVVGWVSAPGG